MDARTLKIRELNNKLITARLYLKTIINSCADHLDDTKGHSIKESWLIKRSLEVLLEIK